MKFESRESYKHRLMAVASKPRLMQRWASPLSFVTWSCAGL